MTEISRNAKILLHVLYHWEELKGHGLVEGGYPVTKEGKRMYERFKAEGFKPTEEEVSDCIKTMMKMTP